MGIRNHYENELNNINQSIIRMGLKVGEMFQGALSCLEEKSSLLADSIIERDQEINQLEQDIEDSCIMLIAREQPVAIDLRKIISALKTVTQLERMGDHAAHIAKALKKLDDADFNHDAVEKLLDMGKIASRNFSKTLTAYGEEDSIVAREIAIRDEGIDNIHKGLMKSLAKDIAMSSDDVEWGLTFIFISRFIERFGDHQLNILEWIIYNKEGIHIEL